MEMDSSRKGSRALGITQQITSPPSALYRRPKLDSDLGDINVDLLLSNDAAKHRLSIKPKKNHLSSHQRSVSPQPKRPLPKPDEKYDATCESYSHPGDTLTAEILF